MTNGNRKEYIYDAAGVKLAKITYGGESGTTRTDYAGSCVYKDNTLDYQIFSEGRKIFNNGTWQYEYHLKDHLGNVRVAFDETGQSLQENHYYPFGLRIADLGLQNSDNKYLYNSLSRTCFGSKEMQDDFGLDWLDYGARFYDAEIGRWHVVDRFSEKYSYQSPYVYAGNNPVKFIDVNGDSLWINSGFRMLLYESGKLYNKKGKEVRKNLTSKIASGKNTSSYLGKAVSSLNQIAGTDVGDVLVSTLQSSRYNFTITNGNGYNFRPTDDLKNPSKHMNNAAANQCLIAGKPILSPEKGFPFNQYGSGGIINWDPSIEVTMITNTGEEVVEPVQSLTHEMGHAYDAAWGQLNFTWVNAVYGNSVEQISEYRADYFLNMVSKRLKLPMRSRHAKGHAPLLKNGNPIYVESPWFNFD